MRTTGRAIALAALTMLGAAGATVAAAPAAGAHAVVRSVEPPDGARLGAPPALVRVEFNEEVSVGLGGLRVFAADGQRVDAGAPRIRGTAVEVDVSTELAEGSYAVTWRVVSADGHPVRGGSVFSVGDTEADPGLLAGFFDDDADRPWELAGGVGRWLAYGGTLLAAGGALFLAAIHGRDAPAIERRRARRLVTASAAIGALGALWALPVQAALGTGSGAGSLFDDGVLGEVLADGVGWSLSATVVGLTMVVVGLRLDDRLAVVGAVVAAGSFALTGHTRVTDPAWVANAADAVHLWAVAVWAGGLWLLVWALRVRRRGRLARVPGGATAAMVRRFSRTATVAVAVVVGTGLALSWTQVRSSAALTSTTYGWVLVTKVATVAVIAAIAAYNRFRLVPGLQPADGASAANVPADDDRGDRLRSRLSGTAALEGIGMVAVVALTAALVVVTPAATAAGIGEIFDETVELSEAGSVQVVVDPARVGPNEIHLYTFDPTGRPADLTESVTLAFTLPSAELGPIEREPRRAGPAHLQLDDDVLAVAGRWELEIVVRVDEFAEETATVVVPVRG